MGVSAGKRSGVCTIFAPGAFARPSGKRVLLQFAGVIDDDQSDDNGVVRAGQLADRTTLYRADLARPLISTASQNPHSFLLGVKPGRRPRSWLMR
jgi:hypothetical protein